MTKPTGKPMGRPRKEIDIAEFEKLCYIQATLEEIAGWFECDVKTIEARVRDHYKDDEGNGLTFSEVFAGLRGKGKIGVRRGQFQRAAKGSDKMLIHLGQQYCNQKDYQDISGNITLTVKYDDNDESHDPSS